MPLFRRKPVIMEAVRFSYPLTQELLDFCGKHTIGKVIRPLKLDLRKGEVDYVPAEMEIHTLEDGKYLKVKHIATEGDWIVKGTNGEYWAVKPDIFEATYEPFIK